MVAGPWLGGHFVEEPRVDALDGVADRHQQRIGLPVTVFLHAVGVTSALDLLADDGVGGHGGALVPFLGPNGAVLVLDSYHAGNGRASSFADVDETGSVACCLKRFWR